MFKLFFSHQTHISVFHVAASDVFKSRTNKNLWQFIKFIDPLTLPIMNSENEIQNKTVLKLANIGKPWQNFNMTEILQIFLYLQYIYMYMDAKMLRLEFLLFD